MKSHKTPMKSRFSAQKKTPLQANSPRIARWTRCHPDHPWGGVKFHGVMGCSHAMYGLMNGLMIWLYMVND